jgi:Secretion system C-terminal sorting domain
MKKLYFLLFTFLITAASFGQLINEFEPNPSGSDPANQSFELKGTPLAAFSGWILSIESDTGSSTGFVDRATSVVGNFDANGFLVVSIPDLENPSFTVVLVDVFTGSVGDDLDTDDDGNIDDLSKWTTVYDAIGSPDTAGDEATLYGANLGGFDFKAIGTTEPDLVFRDGTTEDWYAVTFNPFVYDIDATEVLAGDFDIDPTAGNTFGTVNPSYAGLSTEDVLIDGFSMYPNPTSLGYINIVSKNNETIKATVFDVLGKQVINSTVTNNKLDVSNLNMGVYIMRLTQNNATITKKLVIK